MPSPSRLGAAGAIQGAIEDHIQAGVPGVTLGTNAPSGAIGEVVSSTIASGSAVSLVSNAAKNVASISLTPGDWDVSGSVDFVFNALTSFSNIAGSISTTTNTMGTQDTGFNHVVPAVVLAPATDPAYVTPEVRINVSVTTTVYLVARGVFTLNTLSAYGTIRARRIR